LNLLIFNSFITSASSEKMNSEYFFKNLIWWQRFLSSFSYKKTISFQSLSWMNANSFSASSRLSGF
jgi:hypothetical protein